MKKILSIVIAQMLGLIAVFGLMIAATSANSATIFFDDFNRSAADAVGNGWSESPSTDVSIVTGGLTNNAMRLQGNSISCSSNCTTPDVSASHLNIDTLVSPAYTSLKLSFDWYGTEFEGSSDVNLSGGIAPDALVVSWNTNGGAWNNLAAISLTNGQWNHVSYDLPGGAIGFDNFGIRFASFVTDSTMEFVKIDNVLVTGETSISAIPEPEIYAMLAAGLGLTGFVARRRKQQAAA